MKAVNLIPAEERRSRSGTRSGGAVYVLLGVLAAAVVMATAYAIATHDVKSSKSDLARVKAEAASTQAQADRLKAYTAFADLRQRRIETIASLAASRFDWPHALHEVARTIPKNAWLESLRATVSPDVQVDGQTDPLRQALTNPAVEITGCTTSQQNVARMVSAMRQIDGVMRVSLSSSAKPDSGTVGPATGASPGTGNSAGDSCSKPSRPKFSMTIFFIAPAASAVGTTGTTATAAATASSSSTPASNGAK
jgi:Tfp pilus assembly protein PilN